MRESDVGKRQRKPKEDGGRFQHERCSWGLERHGIGVDPWSATEIASRRGN